MKNQMKIVICGSPHSGKTVFSTSLYKACPESYTYMIRGCPDGEGVFSNNPDQNYLIKEVRRKGNLTPEFAEDIKDQIEKETAPIVLIDVGGKISPENETIFSACNYAIILDSKDDKMDEWREFCKDKGVIILAEIKSILDKNKNESEIYGESPIKANMFNLERGTEKRNDILIKKLVSSISEPLIEKGMEERGRKLLSSDNVLNMRNVAKTFNMINNAGNIDWKKDCANELYYYVKGFCDDRKVLKLFESRANWVTGLACEAAENAGVEDISLYDARQNRYIKTKSLEIDSKLKGDSIEGIERYEIIKDKMYLYQTQSKDEIILHFELNPDRKMEEEDLEYIKLPPIDDSKKLYISGRLPLWIFASVSRSYQNSEKSTLQPGVGYIQFSSSRSRKLGDTIKQLDNIDIEKFFNIVKCDVDSKKQVGEQKKEVKEDR